MNTVHESPHSVMKNAPAAAAAAVVSAGGSSSASMDPSPLRHRPLSVHSSVHSPTRKASPSPGRSSTKLPPFLGHPETFLPPILVALTCAKVLLMPTYRSTDFDVHRNWLAITHNLPISEWYFDNVNGTTVHTLDYPPAFAFFEWILANNPLTSRLFPSNFETTTTTNYFYDRCLDLLPDDDNTPSPTCVVFQRSTVILSDVVLWMGAWLACRAFHHGRPIHHATLCFLLIVLNPGLLWLDHIHFQYNGMLLGVLLASLGCLMQGSNVHPLSWAFDFYHLAGAALYALLVNLKHLYLPLAPVYLVYIFGKYCFVDEGRRFSIQKFLGVAVVTASTLILPWVPFLLQEHPKEQLLQIVARLFPFGRGLVHDYWAANVWAFFSLADKVVRFLAARIPSSMMPIRRLPEPTPMVCATCLLVSILPGLVVISRRRSKTKLLQVVVYTSMCSFMLAYHVHEKAILTALIPLTLLVEDRGDRDRGRMHNFLFWQASLWGLLGLFPLLFRPTELVFKVSSYFAYLEMASYLMTTPPMWIVQQQQLSSATVGVVIGILEFLPSHGNKWEFLPLLLTSIICAHGLIGCWVFSMYLLVHNEKGIFQAKAPTTTSATSLDGGASLGCDDDDDGSCQATLMDAAHSIVAT